MKCNNTTETSARSLWSSGARMTPCPNKSKGTRPLYHHIDQLLDACCPWEGSVTLSEALQKSFTGQGPSWEPSAAWDTGETSRHLGQ